MSTKKYNISVNGQESDNLDLSTIIEMLKTQKLAPTDFVYSDELADWQLVLENTEIMSALKNQTKPSSKPKKVKAKKKKKKTLKESTGTNTKEKNDELTSTDFSKIPNNPMLTEWYVLKGENKFGPFQYTELIKMLQEKTVFEFDFAWKKGMEAWVRIAEINEFCPEHVKKLQESLMPEIKNVFFRRKHPRVPFSGSILIHDNNNVWKGQAVELSEGGAGLIMENSLVVPGQKLYMHFKPIDNLPAFNAICEVVSKKYVEGVKEKSAPICYGVKFTNLSGNTHEYLQLYTRNQQAKTAA